VVTIPHPCVGYWAGLGAGLRSGLSNTKPCTKFDFVVHWATVEPIEACDFDCNRLQVGIVCVNTLGRTF